MAGKVFSDVYNESARDTGDTTTSHVAYVKKKVNDAQREICGHMNFSWLKRNATITLVASTQQYTISDFASDWDEDTPMSIFYRNAASEREDLEPYDDEEWDDEEDIDEGDIYGYNVSKVSGVWKVSFVLVPSSAFVSSYPTLTARYQKYPTELSADGDVPEIPTSQHQALVYWTNKLICAEMGDLEGVATWGRLADDAIGLLKKKQVHRLGRPKRAYPRGCITTKGGRAGRRKDYNK